MTSVHISYPGGAELSSMDADLDVEKPESFFLTADSSKQSINLNTGPFLEARMHHPMNHNPCACAEY